MSEDVVPSLNFNYSSRLLLFISQEVELPPPPKKGKVAKTVSAPATSTGVVGSATGAAGLAASGASRVSSGTNVTTDSHSRPVTAGNGTQQRQVPAHPAAHPAASVTTGAGTARVPPSVGMVSPPAQSKMANMSVLPPSQPTKVCLKV